MRLQQCEGELSKSTHVPPKTFEVVPFTRQVVSKKSLLIQRALRRRIGRSQAASKTIFAKI